MAFNFEPKWLFFLHFSWQDLHFLFLLDPQVQTFSGMLVAAFSFGQFFTCYLWGYLSDKFGRRPILLVGMAFNIFLVPLFGFSVNLEMVSFTKHYPYGFVKKKWNPKNMYFNHVYHSGNKQTLFSIRNLS